MQYCAIVYVTFDISMFMYIYKKSTFLHWCVLYHLCICHYRSKMSIHLIILTCKWKRMHQQFFVRLFSIENPFIHASNNFNPKSYQWIYHIYYLKMKLVQIHIWYFCKFIIPWFNAWAIVCTLQIGCNSKRLFTLTYILWVSRRCLFIYSLEGQQNISVCIRGMWY